MTKPWFSSLLFIFSDRATSVHQRPICYTRHWGHCGPHRHCVYFRTKQLVFLSFTCVTIITSITTEFLYFQTEQLVFLSVLFVMIVIGNTMVLIAIVVSGKRRSRMNFFIINLACAGNIHVDKNTYSPIFRNLK